MKITKLIWKLIKIRFTHGNLDIALFDARKNLSEKNTPSAIGIIEKFYIEVVDVNYNKKELDNKKPYGIWVALSFLNEDYNECGNKK